MKPDYWDKKPSSFAETVQLVETYVRAEIIQETEDKQLYYHTLTHALAVKRRANRIFKAVKFILSQNYCDRELERLESLIGLCAIAHDMVQLFEPFSSIDQPRKRQAGMSETETANKLLRYIEILNQKLRTEELDSSVLFSDRDCEIIRDAIIATICKQDLQASKTNYTLSPYSIYQPYLYDSQPKISIVGSIIALADLGTLGIDGVDNYLQDGILIFLEDNPDLENLVLYCDLEKNSNGDRCNFSDANKVKARLLAMSRFIVNLAYERQARFELEISEFSPQARQILRDEVFIYLNPQSVARIKAIVPTHENVSLSELISFFCLDCSLN